jgi:hypothetical protein
MTFSAARLIDLLPCTCPSVDFIEEQASFCFRSALCSMETFELEGAKGTITSSCRVSKVLFMSSEGAGFNLEDFLL